MLTKLFKIEAGSEKVIELVGRIDEEPPTWAGWTSRWSLLEVARALKKDGKPAEVIALNLRELRRHKIEVLGITSLILATAEELVRTYNIYASDALHAATHRSIRPEPDAFLCDDKHYRRLSGIVKAVTTDQISF